MSKPLLSLRVRRSMSEVSRVNGAVASLWESHQLPKAPKEDVLLSVEEILSNVIHHAGLGPQSEILVRASADDRQIEIQIEDEGPAFNPLSQRPPRLDLPLQQRPRRGLGIHLVRSLMDELRYRRDAGRNYVTLIKRYGD